MKTEIYSRPVDLANYLLEHQTTIRATAKEYGLPKSTVHHDLSTKLKYINYSLYLKVKKLLDENFSIKHLHGGESTKQKYLALKNQPNKNDELDCENECFL